MQVKREIPCWRCEQFVGGACYNASDCSCPTEKLEVFEFTVVLDSDEGSYSFDLEECMLLQITSSSIYVTDINGVSSHFSLSKIVEWRVKS